MERIACNAFKRIRRLKMSFLFHFGDWLLGGKEPVDDGVDKIHRKCTIFLLLILSIPIFTKQFAGDPIECFTPTYFTEAQSRYVNSYCWTVSTFYVEADAGPAARSDVRVHDAADEEADDRDSNAGPHRGQHVKVNYYQWAPIIMLAKALTFYMPFVLWKALAHHHGVSLCSLMKRVSHLDSLHGGHPDRNTLLPEIIGQMQTLFGKRDRRSERPAGHDSVGGCDRRHLMDRLGVWRAKLLLTFMFIKVVYCVNIVLQLYVLAAFLGEDYLTHGFDIVLHLWRKREWYYSPRFPLQTLCSVRAAQQGALRQYQCQCVLPINLFNEKIFSVWWFYVVALVPISVGGLLLWIGRSFKTSRLAFVEHYLWRTGPSHPS